jgi:hypothetical protein
MGWVLRYGFSIKWVPPGWGLGINSSTNTPNLQGQFGGGSGPKLTFFDTTPPASQTFTATDVTNFMSTMQTDMSNQLTAQQTRISNWGANTFPATG